MGLGTSMAITLPLLVVSMVRRDEASAPSALLTAPEAPWATEAAAEFVIIAGTQRGASTSAAEALGSTHPCSASFNEVFRSAHFPEGFGRYRSDATYANFLTPCPLRHDRWLQDAIAARDSFCNTRPQEVKNVCGSVCVVVLKMHLNQMIDTALDPAWVQLLSSERVRAAVIERDARDTYCSIHRSEVSGDWGHTPSEHSLDRPSRDDVPCDPMSDAANLFEEAVRHRFNTTRALLISRRDADSWIDLPFDEYVSDTTAARARLYELAGLLTPPPAWRDACALAWCANYSWPLRV